MPTLDSTFEIPAPPAIVWDALTDFARFGEWNPALPSVTGEARVGSTLDIALVLGPGAKPMAVQAEVLTLDTERRFTWRGHLGADVVFSGFRDFTLEPTEGGGTRIRHVESVTGLIAPLFYAAKRKGIHWHHRELNESLGRRAVALSGR